MKKYIVFLGLVFFLPARGWAFLGAGDIVFDPTAYAQLLQAYAQGESQLQALSSMVGLNTEQLGSLKSIDASIGVALPGINLKELTTGQIASLSQGLGVDVSLSLGKAYQSTGPFSGALDVFMGTTLESFRKREASPWRSFARSSSEDALGALGLAVGMNNGEIQFAAELDGMSAADRSKNRLEISRGLAALGAVRFAAGGENRRLAIQAEVNISQQAADRAAKAKNVNENGAAHSEILASQARLQAVAAQQQNEANEKLFDQGEITNASLAELEDHRAREELELRLADETDGNVY